MASPFENIPSELLHVILKNCSYWDAWLLRLTSKTMRKLCDISLQYGKGIRDPELYNPYRRQCLLVYASYYGTDELIEMAQSLDTCQHITLSPTQKIYQCGDTLSEKWAREGNVKKLSIFIPRGFWVENYDLLRIALKYNQPEIVRWLMTPLKNWQHLGHRIDIKGFTYDILAIAQPEAFACFLNSLPIILDGLRLYSHTLSLGQDLSTDSAT